MSLGNYWLDLIELEKKIQAAITKVIELFVGKRYSSSKKLHEMIKEAVTDCLEEVAVSEKIPKFQVDYDVQLDFEGELLTGAEVKSVFAYM